MPQNLQMGINFGKELALCETKIPKPLLVLKTAQHSPF